MTWRATSSSREEIAAAAMAQVKYYKQRCGITAFLRAGSGRIFVPAGIVGAIVAPAAQAATLVRRLPLVVPAIVHRQVGRRTTWTLLTAPVPDHLRRSARTREVLDRCGAGLVDEGDEIALPSPGDPALRWHGGAPTDRYRPSPVSILTAMHGR
ncbi:hypothetical protein [Nocardia sp. NPDC050717]|uniref:hypothetical protein n=1 Tax=Nocardia sp. NPDC050717 TaxID=3157221 RepID=UPI00340339E0